MKDFVRRLALPLVFAMIGVETILLNFTTLKRREFEYIPKEGPRQMFSAAQTPTVYWIVTIGIFVVGALFLAAAIFLFSVARQRLRQKWWRQPPAHCSAQNCSGSL